MYKTGDRVIVKPRVNQSALSKAQFEAVGKEKEITAVKMPQQVDEHTTYHLSGCGNTAFTEDMLAPALNSRFFGSVTDDPLDNKKSERIFRPEEDVLHNVDDFAVEIHQNALAHGWWDDERSFAEIVALCHSELSEALEADRSGEPLIWDNDGKPDGAAVEMADCVIRIMDWFGKVGISLEEVLRKKHEYNKSRPYKHGRRY